MTTETGMPRGRGSSGYRSPFRRWIALPAGKVGKSLDRVEGIRSYDLHPTAGTATVTYNPGSTRSSDVIGAIERAGYEAERRPDESHRWKDGTAPSKVWTSSRGVRTWIGAGFLVAGLSVQFLIPGWNLLVATTPLYSLTVADVGFIIAILVSGIPVVRSGYYSARNRNLDIDLLMGTAIVSASAIGLFIEAATLAVLYSIAELLERFAMDQTRDSLRELMELAPDEANVIRNGEEIVLPVSEVVLGDRIMIRPGQKIPVDGIVSEGGSAVDQSPITGESLPVDKTEGDEVYAGSINDAGYLELEATSTASDSTLSQIIELISEAESNKTEREQFVDRFASIYTPIVVVLALLTAFLPPLLISESVTVGVAGFAHTFVDDWTTWFVRGLTLLVIACPCAFVISTPVSVTSGITSAARNGVLIKGGNYLEAMGEINVIAFDKTGTLTRGELTVTDVISLGPHDETSVLHYVGGLEQRSEHPIADAIRERLSVEDIEPSDITAFESITGKGVRGRVGETRVFAGNPAWFAEMGVSTEPRADGGLIETAGTLEVVERLQRAGKTVILVGTEDGVMGILGIADDVRPTAKRAVEQLQRLGVGPLIMLTGDKEGTARAVADEIGIDEYRAELLPEEKVEAVEELEETYGGLAMVGDGINDAPALATAAVGVAMGAAGTDTAIETADIALMGDDIGKLPYLFALSHKANGIIRQNIWSSLGVKLLLAIGVPFGYVSVAIAILMGDMGMSLGVTGNAMRLARMVPDRLLD